MRVMTGQFYFTTLAGIALSVAGFASLITALRGDGHWSSTDLWRLRNILSESLTIVVFAVVPFPIFYAAGGDEALTIRIVSGLIALNFARRIWGTFGERQEWGGRYVAQVVVIVGTQTVGHIANIWLASLPLLMVGLLAWLIFPIQLFLRVIRDFHPPAAGD